MQAVGNMLSGLAFAWPAVFLLLPLPWLLRRHLAARTTQRRLRLPASGWFATTAQAAAPAAAPARMSAAAWLAWLTWALLLLAAARPQLPDHAAQLPVSGRSMILGFDLSASMATTDLAWQGRRLSRLDAAKTLARDFLARREGDRVGLVVFGKRAYVHVPPSFDLRAVSDALDATAVGLAGNETALGDAIALATRQLGAQPDPARVLVLLTDGASTAGSLTPQRAAWLAARGGVRIHAVGIGGEATGRAAFDLDEAGLREITAQTGGSYRRATDGAALAEFFAELERLEPLPDHDDAKRPARELYPWPLLAALALAAWMAWRARRRSDDTDLWAAVVDARLQPHVLVASGAATASRLPRVLAALLAALALALPSLPTRDAPGIYRAAALRVLVADLSDPATDAALRARLAALLGALPPGETALVLSANDAYLAVPPTADANTILALVPELAAAIMPEPGAQPERAQALAEQLLARNSARDGTTLWLTAAPERIAALPVAPGTRRHVIDLRAADAGATIEAAVAALGASAWRFEPPSAKAGTASLAGLAMLALLPLAVLGFRRGLIFAVLLAPTFVLAPVPLSEALAQTNNTANDPRWQAVASYRAGQHEEVLRLLAHYDDAVSHYNRGNALMRLGRFAEAEEAYAASLAKHPNDADTKFNLELAKRLRPPPPSPPPKSPPPPSGSGTGQPPPPSTSGAGQPPPPAPAAAEAARVAEQWLRGVPDDPGGLLRAKLKLEHERRRAATGGKTG
jgi:Ca-activated chloride channel family protein